LPEQIINKLREAEILLNQGITVGEASKKIGQRRVYLVLPELARFLQIERIKPKP